MAFVISSAATAASAAAFVAAGGVAAGTTAVTAATIGSVVGGGLAAGALGAGLGAGTAALTGGDIGKGALMGGVGGALTGGMASGLSSGLGAAASGTGASTAIGAASGAAGGAAGAAAGGEDPLTGAALGGAAGGIGGYMKGVDSVGTGETLADVSDVGGSTAPAPASGGVKISPATLSQTPLGPDIPIAFEPNPTPMTSGEMSSAIRQPITTSAPPMGPGSYASNTAAINAVNTPSAVSPAAASPSNVGYIDKGVKLIKDNPAIAMQLGGAAMNMMGGTSSKQQSQAPATASIYDPIPYIQQDIPRTTVPQYYYDTDVGYAFGGSVTDSSQQGQMNPIVARAMQQIQQAQPQAQQPQPALQSQQTHAPQGIMGVQPMLQQPLITQPIIQQPIIQHPAMAQPIIQQPAMAQPVQPMPQAQPTQMAATGGMMRDNLGGYSHGGIAGLTRGPGTGISDDIPAQIGDSGKQPARLADGEFVVPSRVVSELGQGSTEAGAKMLQAMVNRVQARRSKTVGKGKVAADSKASKELLA